MHGFTSADKLLKLLEPIENATVPLQAEDKPVIHKTDRILLWLVFTSDKLDIKHLQGYALHGHMNLHTWHTHVGSTGTSVQYIPPVPWSRDCYLLGTRSLVNI